MKKSLKLFKDVSFVKPNQFYSIRCFVKATFSLLVLSFVYAGVVYAAVNINLDTYSVRLDKYIQKSLSIYGLIFIGFLFLYPVYVMLFVRPNRLFNYLKDGYRWHLFSKERVLFSYPVLMIIPLDFSIYTSFKNDIPSLNSFWLDAPLYNLDKVIFWGGDPWRIFQHLIGDPNITRAIDILYHPVWLLLLIITVLLHALGRHSLKVRLRFFLSFIIVWAGLGNALATILSSAGPCYYTQVTGLASPYAELMGYLYSIKTNGLVLNAIRLQEWLWNNHLNGIVEYGSGISAMPSIHIATTVLFALGMRKSYPILEKLLYIYVFIIWVGSIQLGWHYASDGLVSGFLVIGIWYLMGKLTDKIMPDSELE